MCAVRFMHTVWVRIKNLTGLPLDDPEYKPDTSNLWSVAALLQAQEAFRWVRERTSRNPDWGPLKVGLAFSSRLCSDPRDKVFAAVGVMNMEDRPVVHIDYRKSMKDVYCDFAKNMVLRFRPSLNVLCVAGIPSKEAAALDPTRPLPEQIHRDTSMHASGNRQINSRHPLTCITKQIQRRRRNTIISASHAL